jgi:succinoglycan biosynthesis transport protein ExoP
MTLPATIHNSLQLSKRDEAFALDGSGIEARGSLLSVLWRWRGLFLGLAATTYLVLGAASFFLPRTYSATSLLAYDVRPMRAVISAVSQPRSTDEMISERVEPSVLASEADIITSRSTILRMLEDRPDLAEPPVNSQRKSDGPNLFILFTHWIVSVLPNSLTTSNAEREEIITRISQHLSATIPHSSSLIRVSFQTADPDYAAAVANAIVAAYLKDQVAAKRGAIRSTIQHLQARLTELGQQVVATDQAVQDFRSQHNLLKPTAGIPLPDMQQLADLSIQEGRVKADIASEAARRDALKAMSPPAVAALQPESGPGSQMTQVLANLEIILQKRLSDHEGRYLDSSSEIILMKDQIAKVRRALSQQGQLIIQHQQAAVDVLKERLATLERTKESVSSDVQSENGLDSQLLRLTTEAQSAKASYDVFLTGFTRMSMLENTQVPDVRVVDPASPPIRPAISEVIILILLLPVSGLIAGIIVTICHSRKSGMGLTDRAFERTFGLPVLGVTPYVPKMRRFYRWAAEHARQTSYCDQTLSTYSNAVRGIRNMVDLHLSDEPNTACQSVAVVSAVSGEGKSGMAISLAAAWAAGGKSVLLIDCDVYQPILQRLYDGIDDDKGSVGYLGSQADLSKIIKPISRNFDLLPAGRTMGGVFHDFGKPQLRDLLAKLTGSYDRVLLDLPPVMTGSDAQIGAAVADLTLLVSRWQGTPKFLTEGTVERLRGLNLKRLAAVLTQANMKKYYSELGITAYVYAQQPL